MRHQRENKNAVTDGAFVVDILIEIVGLLTSLVGLKIKLPNDAMSKIKLAIAAFIRSPRGRRVYLDLLHAIRIADWGKVFRLIHKTELGTIFGEIFAHMFADMSWKDYAIAIGKLLVFIGICAVSGGAGLTLKLAAVALDLVGLGLKVKHGYEHGI